MDECIFCKIISGEVPSHKVYEDAHVLAFMDINPITEGHVQVVPKKHVEQLWDIDDALYQYMMAINKRIALNIRAKLNPFRVGVIVEGFEVPHAHYHLIPLNEGMKQSLNDRTSSAEPDHTKLEEVAKKLFLEKQT